MRRSSRQVPWLQMHAADPCRTTVLITGASRGIGAAAAIACARAGLGRGRQLHPRRSLPPKRWRRRCVRSAGAPSSSQADVADEAAVLAMFARIDAELGALSGLVNNAGVVDVTGARRRDQRRAPAAHVRDQRLRQLRLRARSHQAHEHASMAAHGGAIVNLSSVAARLGAPGWYVDYAASKGAIDTFTIGLAREVARRRHPRQRRAPGHHRHRHPRLGRPARPRAGAGAR